MLTTEREIDFGAVLKVHHGVEGMVEQKDLYHWSHETQRESLQNQHMDDTVAVFTAPFTFCAA